MNDRGMIVIGVAGAIVAVAAVLGVALVVGGPGAAESPLATHLAGFLALLVPLVVSLVSQGQMHAKLNGHLGAHRQDEANPPE